MSKISSKNKGSQLRHSTRAEINRSRGRTKPIVTPEYIVGFTDGEGCFYVNVSKSPAYRAGYAVQLHFHIKVNEKDKAVLEKIRNTLNCGGVYFQKEKRRNHAQCYRYTVSSNKEILEKVIPFFHRNPLHTATKQKSFSYFCKIAELVQNGEHLKHSGVIKIQRLKSQMNLKTVGFA